MAAQPGGDCAAYAPAASAGGMRLSLVTIRISARLPGLQLSIGIFTKLC